MTSLEHRKLKLNYRVIRSIRSNLTLKTRSKNKSDKFKNKGGNKMNKSMSKGDNDALFNYLSTYCAYIY